MSLPRIVGRPGDARSVIGDPWWVLSRRAGPFPLVEVRDLLGIVRALYRSGREDNAGAAYLERLERIGRKLQLAIELAAAGPDTVGERAAFLSEGMEVKVESYEGKPIAVKLPVQVTLTVAETDPAVKGQTAAPSYKPATLENGLRVMVPPFIENGSKIIVSTDDVEYVKRAE